MRLLGTVDRRPSGRYRYRVRVRGKLSSTSYATEREALAAQLVVSRRAANPDRQTLADYGRAYLDHREVRQRARAIGTDRSRWRAHVEGTTLARTPLTEITTADVEAWADRLSGSVQTRKHAVNLVRQCLARAKRERLIRSNPAVGVLVDGTIEAAWTYLSESEQRQLVDAIDGPEWMVVAFAIGTGLRQGEQWSLRLVDVEPDAVTVRFGGPGNRTTKTARTRRVPLLPWVQAVLAAWLEQLPAYLGRYRNELGLVFPTPRGCRRRDKKPPRPWAKWLAAARIQGVTGSPVCWHSLRHTCASMLVSGAWGRRWTLQEVAELLGHTSVETTERYAHLAEGTIARAAAETSCARPGDPQTPRATVDSNHWPSAPEARVVRLEDRTVASVRTQARTLALDVLRLAADRDPLVVAVAVRLAAAVLEEAERREGVG